MNIWERLQNIDRRVLYALLALSVSLPFLVAVPVPQAAGSPQARGFHETLEALANDPARKNKLVIVSASFSASTAAENLTQTETILRHLMRRRLRFALVALTDPQGRELAQQTAERLQGQYGYVYGRDYVNWGFRPPQAFTNTVKAMVRDIPGAFGTDYRGTKLADLPVMRGVRGVDDVGAVIEVTGSNSLQVWLAFFTRTGKVPTPTLYACTAVMAPEAFPFLKSGQIQGMLVGLKGAIEYEGMLGERGFATKASASLSYAHFLIVALIVVGNIGMLATRGRAQSAAGRAPLDKGSR